MLLGCSCTRHRISHLSHISNSMGDVSGCLLRCDVHFYFLYVFFFLSPYFAFSTARALFFILFISFSAIFTVCIFTPSNYTPRQTRHYLYYFACCVFFVVLLSLSLLIFLCSLPSTTYAPSTCTEYINISMNFTYHFDGMAFVLYYSICVCGVCSLRLLWSSRC